MPTDSGTNDILSLGFLHYTTAVSREMSDEPFIDFTETPHYSAACTDQSKNMSPI